MKACLYVFFQGNKGRLSLKHLMNLGTRPHAAEPDLSNPLSPLMISSTNRCRSNITPTLAVLIYLLLIVKLFFATRPVQTENNFHQPYWKCWKLSNSYRSSRGWGYERKELHSIMELNLLLKHKKIPVASVNEELRDNTLRGFPS